MFCPPVVNKTTSVSSDIYCDIGGALLISKERQRMQLRTTLQYARAKVEQLAVLNGLECIHEFPLRAPKSVVTTRQRPLKLDCGLLKNERLLHAIEIEGGVATNENIKQDIEKFRLLRAEYGEQIIFHIILYGSRYSFLAKSELRGWLDLKPRPDVISQKIKDLSSNGSTSTSQIFVNVHLATDLTQDTFMDLKN